MVPAASVPKGVACWFGPTQHGPSEEAMMAAGFSDVLDAFGPAASARMLDMTSRIEREHTARTTGPHLRLDFFGVDPSLQGTGIGSALLDYGHRRADEEGLSCYLETFTEWNVGYYRRRGYALTGTYEVADGVPVYVMERPGRGPASEG